MSVCFPSVSHWSITAKIKRLEKNSLHETQCGCTEVADRETETPPPIRRPGCTKSSVQRHLSVAGEHGHHQSPKGRPSRAGTGLPGIRAQLGPGPTIGCRRGGGGIG